MWKHIRGFVARGGSVLLTTHYLDEADALADRIAVIDQRPHHRPGHARRNQAARALPAGLEDAFLSLVRQNGNSIEEVLQ